MSKLSDLEKKVLSQIKAETIIESASKLIEIPSITGDEAEAQRQISEMMNRLGMKVDRWDIDLDRIRKHPDFSMGVERKNAVGVVGRYGGEGGKTLILNGHIDVVSAGDESNWSRPPWKGTLDNGRLYGRGSVDMKGGLACAITAIGAIADSGTKLRGNVVLESVVGEEDGGVGALATVLRGYRGDGAVIMEPTELKLSPAQAGSNCFRITIRGLSAHACVREEGVSALDKFMPIYRALTDLEKIRNESVTDPLYTRYKLPIPLNLGVVRCGNWPSTVPEGLVLEGRYGIGVDENFTEARQRFEEAVQHAADTDDWLTTHRPVVEWRGGQFTPARTPITEPIVKTLEASFTDATSTKPVYEGMTYGSDMRHLVNVGKTPTLLFGPGDVRLCHRPNESVSVSDLVSATRTLALTTLRFCGSDN
jgi:acetylornithine deacetylase